MLSTRLLVRPHLSVLDMAGPHGQDIPFQVIHTLLDQPQRVSVWLEFWILGTEVGPSVARIGGLRSEFRIKF